MRQASTVHHHCGERPSAADRRAEEGAFVVAGDTGGADVFIQEGL
jgi:hypothetical protein